MQWTRELTTKPTKSCLRHESSSCFLLVTACFWLVQTTIRIVTTCRWYAEFAVLEIRREPSTSMISWFLDEDLEDLLKPQQRYFEATPTWGNWGKHDLCVVRNWQVRGDIRYCLHCWIFYIESVNNPFIRSFKIAGETCNHEGIHQSAMYETWILICTFSSSNKGRIAFWLFCWQLALWTFLIFIASFLCISRVPIQVFPSDHDGDGCQGHNADVSCVAVAPQLDLAISGQQASLRITRSQIGGSCHKIDHLKNRCLSKTGWPRFW